MSTKDKSTPGFSQDIIKAVKDLDLPMGKYAVAGSCCLEIRGIRKANDIDIVAFPELRIMIIQKGGFLNNHPEKPESLFRDNFEIGFDWDFGIYSRPVEDVIKEAEIIQGIPFVPLEEILRLKRALRREKDVRDIKLIEEYLKKNEDRK
jgi:hypothetical protein